MSSIATSLNQLLASNFSEVGKADYVPLRLPQINPNTIQAPDQSDQSELQDRRQQDQQQALVDPRAQQRQQQNLSDFARPQVRLLPSDEVQLFARAALENSTALSPAVTQQAANVSEETNRARRAVLTSDNRDSLSQTLQSRAQESVAYLYARNANAVYNVEPLLFEAA